MADKKATLLIQLKDKASKGLGSLKSAMGGLKKVAAGLGIAIGGLGVFLFKSIKAFGIQELQSKKLEVALSNVKTATEGGAAELIKYAGELERVTTFGDEQIISAQAMLATFQLNEKQIKAITPRLLDMAAASEKATGQQADLQQIAIALGKGFTGQIGTLSRYGVVLDEQKIKTEGFNGILSSLDDNFKGMAEGSAKTLNGQMALFKNTFGTLQEKIGEALAGSFLDLLKKLQELTDKVAENRVGIGKFANSIIMIGEIGFAVFQTLGEEIGTFSFVLFELISALLDFHVGNWQKAWESFKNATLLTTDSIVDGQNKINNKIAASVKKFKENNKKLIDADKKGKATILKQQVAHNVAMVADDDVTKKLKVAAAKKEAEEIKKIKEKEIAEEIARNKRKVAEAQGYLATISSMQQSHNKTAFAIGKAAAIANAIISTAQGAASALKWGFPLGPIFAALIAAAGVVQIQKIGATSMAEGGVVLPTSGGTLARVAEAGRPEAIIPLDDDRAGEFIGGATININAGVFVGDDEGIRQLAEMIDEKMFDLDRNNQSVAL